MRLTYSYIVLFWLDQVIMGGGRRYFMRADQRDPEDGSNTRYGRIDTRDLIEVSLFIVDTIQLYTSLNIKSYSYI